MQNQANVARALSQFSGSGVAGGSPTPTQTLAARLDSAVSQIAYQASRLESVLSRVNGTPQSAQATEKGMNNASTAPLVSSVTSAEELGARLASLVEGVERIA